MSRSRVLRGLGALVASAALVLSGSLTAQAASPTVTATGAYGDCPVTLWSDGTLEFTCSALNNTDDKGWSGDISKSSIKSVKSGNITAKGSLSSLFSSASSLTDISDLAKWDTSNVTNMAEMFYGASSLVNVDGLAKWDTSNVGIMVHMFAGASSLVNVDGLAKWDTSNVAQMWWMFQDASSLKEASFANAKGFANQPDVLELTASRAWSRITIGKDAKPNLELPENMVWVNTTRGDGEQVSSADMSAQIKAGKGEGVWKRVSASDPSPSVTPSVKPSASASPKPSGSASPSVKPSPTASPKPSVSPSVSPVPGGSCAAVDSGKQQAVYRLYNPVTSEHLFTTDAKEYGILAAKHGWKQEGTAWMSPRSGVGVYRLYNAGLGDHHYTKDKNEAAALVNKFGWVYDNNAKPLFYSEDNASCSRVPVYRQYNPSLTSGQHHYTADEKEAKALITKYGWKNEAIGWYAVKK